LPRLRLILQQSDGARNTHTNAKPLRGSPPLGEPLAAVADPVALYLKLAGIAIDRDRTVLRHS